MSNLSKQRREKMLEFLNKIKDKLKDDSASLIALNEIENELKNKKYGLIWEKHEEQVDLMMNDNVAVFSELKEREIDAYKEKPYNFLLEGDNLHSLKLLEKTHKGKIDIIYIDPPYNTGNKDFIYDDKMVGFDDGYRHSKWLSFMNERLKIAKNLLSDSGVIFISIDDNEMAQLKLLCDSIFGEDNFIANYKWNKTSTPPSLSKKVRKKYEYVICYEKKTDNTEYNGGIVEGGDMPLLNTGNGLKKICFPKESVKFNFDGEFLAGKKKKVFLCNDINIKNGVADKDIILEGEFKWLESTVLEEIKKGTKFVIKSSFFSIRYIRNKQRVKRPADIISKVECDVDTNEQAKKELFKIIGDNNMSYPKPVSLIKYLLGFKANPNAIVLDFFAGSGTTGHAVAELNKEDGGNRTYILCTNNENNICEEVTYKRLKNIQEDLPHNLKYYKTDFIAKADEDLMYKMMEHIAEMVQLEHGVKIDNNEYKLILSDEEADKLEENLEKYQNLKALYVSRGVLFTAKQKKLFEYLEMHVIPDYYFASELRKEGLIW